MDRQEKKKVKYLNLRVSDWMKNRINRAFELEGIDWTSLAKAKIYDFVLKVEAGEEPEMISTEYLKNDIQAKDKFLQIQLDSSLNDRFNDAASKKNISKTEILLPYLIKLTIQAEQRHGIEASE